MLMMTSNKTAAVQSLPALDPRYSVRGPIREGKFTISRSGPPTAEEQSNEQIINMECSDLEVNTLVWQRKKRVMVTWRGVSRVERTVSSAAGLDWDATSVFERG